MDKEHVTEETHHLQSQKQAETEEKTPDELSALVKLVIAVVIVMILLVTTVMLFLRSNLLAS